MNEQKTEAEHRDKDGRENTGGEILLQYNGSFRKDSGLPVGSDLIHNAAEQFWSRGAFYKVDKNNKKKTHISFYISRALDGWMVKRSIRNSGTSVLPTSPPTAFSTAVSEAPFVSEATASNCSETNSSGRQRKAGGNCEPTAAAKDASIDAKHFTSFLRLKKISTTEKMLRLQS